jgi:ribosomal subunit interface protein
MKYQITSDNIQISPSMETLTKEKFARIENRLKDIPEGSKSIRVVLNGKKDDKFTVKVVADMNGKEYFSDETDFSLESAIIKTVEELLRMMEEDKSKNHRIKEKAWEEIRESKRCVLE